MGYPAAPSILIRKLYYIEAYPKSYHILFMHASKLTFCYGVNGLCELLQLWLNFWTEWKWKNYALAGLLYMYMWAFDHSLYILCMSSYFSFSFQLLAGLSKPTSGSIYIQRYTDDGKPNQSPKSLVPERVGIVFQFPERCLISTEKFCLSLFV